MWLHIFFFFKQKTAYEMRISDWSSDVCSSDLDHAAGDAGRASGLFHQHQIAGLRVACIRYGKFAPFLLVDGAKPAPLALVVENAKRRRFAARQSFHGMRDMTLSAFPDARAATVANAQSALARALKHLAPGGRGAAFPA